jgi:hypothetical protein
MTAVAEAPDPPGAVRVGSGVERAGAIAAAALARDAAGIGGGVGARRIFSSAAA